MRRRFSDILAPALRATRRLFADILPSVDPRPRRKFADLLKPARRKFADLLKPARRKFADLTRSVRRKFADLLRKDPEPEIVDTPPKPTPQFEPPDFHNSAYHKWAAHYFHEHLWKALPQEEVDDLLQDAYIKYARCVELYVYGACTCRGPGHLMSIFKAACNNMLTDRSRKKQRCSERYQNYAVDPSKYLDNSLQTAIELLDVSSEQIEEYQHAIENL